MTREAGVCGARRHEGKVPTTEHQTRLSRTLPSAASDSLYRATFSAAAAQAQGKDPATLRASGGHWIKTRSRGADVPLSSSTTYRCEILGHEEKADALATTRGSTTTTAGFVVGRNVEHPAPCE